MKKFGVFIFGLLMFSMVAGLVSASNVITGKAISDDIDSSIDGIIETAKPLLERILGATPSSEWLFAKFLFFVIILAVVWKVLSKIEFFTKNAWTVWVISIAVSVLSVRWLESVEMVQTILLPYTTLGVTIAAGIPFIIFFLVVTVGMKDTSPTARRLAWVAFAVVFVGLWLSRIGELGDAGYIYLVFAIASFIMIKLDGTLQRAMDQIAIEKAFAVTDQVKYVRLLKERRELQETLVETVEEGLRGKIEASINHIDTELKKLRSGAYRKMGKEHKSVFNPF